MKRLRQTDGNVEEERIQTWREGGRGQRRVDIHTKAWLPRTPHGHHVRLRRHGPRMGVKAAQPSACRAALENSARGTSHVESLCGEKSRLCPQNTHEKRYEKFQISSARVRTSKESFQSFSF